MENENCFRHELKYEINKSDSIEISHRLSCVAQKDPYADCHGFYHVHSLYFDNVYDKALREKLDGTPVREKFRIRFYNEDTGFIRLEKKEKVRGLCRKTGVCLPLEDCQKLLKGENKVLWQSKNALCRELYAKMHYQILRPKTIVDYHRQVFLYPQGNVRITLDFAISSRQNIEDFFAQKEANLCESSPVILEVKFDDYLPRVIQDMVQVKNRGVGAFSKYALCRTM